VLEEIQLTGCSHVPCHIILWYIYIIIYIWYMIYDIWYMIHDTWYMIYDIWYHAICSMVLEYVPTVSYYVILGGKCW
jgi:hypothetical protein